MKMFFYIALIKKEVYNREKCRILQMRIAVLGGIEMSDLLGIIAPLKKFLSKTEEKICVPLSSNDKEILSLSADRIYTIPDFQREIRWGNDNVAQLIDDIDSGPKYLGNVILTQHSDNLFSIIDGQQRITILTMILLCIKKYYDE